MREQVPLDVAGPGRAWVTFDHAAGFGSGFREAAEIRGRLDHDPGALRRASTIRETLVAVPGDLDRQLGVGFADGALIREAELTRIVAGAAAATGAPVPSSSVLTTDGSVPEVDSTAYSAPIGGALSIAW
jgi:hypothetical protein